MSQKTVSNPTVWYRNYYGNLVKLVKYFVKIEIVISTLQDFWWYLWRLEVIFVRYWYGVWNPASQKSQCPPMCAVSQWELMPGVYNGETLAFLFWMVPPRRSGKLRLLKSPNSWWFTDKRIYRTKIRSKGFGLSSPCGICGDGRVGRWWNGHGVVVYFEGWKTILTMPVSRLSWCAEVEAIHKQWVRIYCMLLFLLSLLFIDSLRPSCKLTDPRLSNFRDS